MRKKATQSGEEEVERWRENEISTKDVLFNSKVNREHNNIHIQKINTRCKSKQIIE